MALFIDGLLMANDVMRENDEVKESIKVFLDFKKNYKIS